MFYENVILLLPEKNFLQESLHLQWFHYIYFVIFYMLFYIFYPYSFMFVYLSTNFPILILAMNLPISFLTYLGFASYFEVI